ncbi:hypothetical protein DDZ14_08505 [Maritimibacter sp. 55A14]|uniref:DUF6441 family protein n=1 Tax=Maritimibacter sp. 55A14 TaxID=2174844 RepID=UPI000D61E6F7|nr:DUF6441 family protein [Maritimibacter sp. 55A14]PWE32777.1 hypothetical protein DDZ14_08505 [Maritimibacter sp. 55A14]
MKLGLEIKPKLAAVMAGEIEAGERAVTKGITSTSIGLKTDWRQQITGAGLGRRLANAIRSEVFPKGQPSLEAAALVWSSANDIVDAHDRGATIRARSGFFLAIPTDAAGRAPGGRRLTPGQWEQRRGTKLRFVRRRGKPSLLVTDDARINTRGVAQKKRGKRRKDGTLTGATTVPIFVLMPQVKLPARLDLDADTRKWDARLPDMIVDAWVSRKVGGE